MIFAHIRFELSIQYLPSTAGLCSVSRRWRAVSIPNLGLRRRNTNPELIKYAKDQKSIIAEHDLLTNAEEMADEADELDGGGRVSDGRIDDELIFDGNVGDELIPNQS